MSSSYYALAVDIGTILIPKLVSISKANDDSDASLAPINFITFITLTAFPPMLAVLSEKYTSHADFILMEISSGIEVSCIVSITVIPVETRYLHLVRKSSICPASAYIVKRDIESIMTQSKFLELLLMYLPITGNRNDDCFCDHTAPYTCSGSMENRFCKNAVVKLNVIVFIFSI